MSFTQTLRKENDYLWERSFQHPFVQGIVNGDLSLDRFKFYVIQDSYYLSHFAKIQAMAGVKAIDMETTERFLTHAQNTSRAELSLHQDLMKRLSISEEDKRKYNPAQTAYAYTSHLYRVALNGGTGEILAALLPCYWLYYEIGNRNREAKPEDPIFREWLQTYSSDWFKELALEQIERLDRIAEQSSEGERRKMANHFNISSYYELAFWEMAYKKEMFTGLINNQSVEVK